MKFTITTLALPLLAASAPTPEPPANPAFGVMAMRSASPIHFAQLNAAGQKFYLHGETASYCPEQVQHCPLGKQTVFAPGGGSLDVMVPGGQQVYIDPNGALSFTQAHSANIPEGSVRGPFHYTADEPWAHYSFAGWGATGFMACPTDDDRWQVFAAIQNATVPHGNVDECLGFSAVALTYDGEIPAWQYI
ncbi:hypothetical protein N7491_001626 [Penicillium cf. griseofulvum]|uniref:IgE-binding protein n=1 Tax=Penicillium cf. griseofulvum TaxID=2972120 RepID=A0A9W9MA37_9EURO|nr:hypothetical protein N7472_006755 [Penicillium cf. griseofulvum]KAJ5445544.1 hypothetical protein N7491_001626 [Penicillium cf. griseofulvum]KAJ5447264.1 hypothetical protein N7445_002085 [Penicillium cf. griseofulvum]